MIDMVNKDPQAPGIAINNSQDSRSTVMLHNWHYVKEFIQKVDKFEKVTIEGSNAPLAGLLMKNGDEAVHHRALVNEIFHYDALAETVPDICKITHDRIVEFN